jgi:hypothetical protein
LNKNILQPEVQDFIQSNSNADITSVSLGKSPFPGVAPRELAQQLSGRKKAEHKMPLWYQTPGIFYPPALNLEQASSEATASYKGSLVSGGLLVDLTGGFGVDDFYFSRTIQEVHYCEQDPQLAEIASHNFKRLGAENIVVHTGDGMAQLPVIASENDRIDWIYLDPSRRKKDRTRVFRLEDYEPRVAEILPELFRASPNVLLKTSPLLDLTEGAKELGNVREVHVVGIRNEVKELLWWLQEGYEGDADRIALDLFYGNSPFRFALQEEQRSEVAFSRPSTYLYEPNASLLKAGAFKTVGARFGLGKLHRHTHLYTSETLIPFPGRVFKILRTLPYKPGKLPFHKANVSVRNFPENVSRIRKRNRIKDGGNTYLFFIKSLDDSLQVLACEPVKAI